MLLRGGRLATAAQHDADSLLIEAGRIAWIGASKDAPRAGRTAVGGSAFCSLECDSIA